MSAAEQERTSGTIAHELTNVVLALRLRLEAMRAEGVPVSENFTAVRTAVDRVQALADELRRGSAAVRRE